MSNNIKTSPSLYLVLNRLLESRLFNNFIFLLIILSLLTFSLETIPEFHLKHQEWLNYSEIVIVLIFSFEYLARVIASKNKISFIFSFYGLIDLFAILPFYFSLGIDLRSIRIIRLFKLFRAFKLIRLSNASKRLYSAFKSVKEEFMIFGGIAFFMIYVSSVGIYYFENPVQPEKFRSIFHSMWWAVETLTSVGYGEIYPVTTGGKIFTSVIAVTGLGIVAIPSGLLASALTKIKKKEDKQVKHQT